MSTTTDVLSLFKYDPVADADSTFNITQGLNNNWDKLDAALLLAIAAAGAYNPEESYAVGDYCTYKGKLRKCSTAIPTGETWTETHWTTTTVAEELAELSSQLSNLESSKAPSGYGLGANCTQITDWNTAIANGWYKNTTYDPDSHSPDALAWYGLTINYSDDILVQLAFHADNVNSCRAAFRWQHAGAWSNWEPIATATKPQEFDLPFAAGIAAAQPCTYRKNQFGEVSISGTAIGTISRGATFATLPEGFRPLNPVERPAVYLVSGSLVAGTVVVTADGSISAFGPTSAERVAFAADFVAAS